MIAVESRMLFGACLMSVLQVLVEYAVQADRRHNGRLLLHYGFVIPGNPYDSVSIKVRSQ